MTFDAILNQPRQKCSKCRDLLCILDESGFGNKFDKEGKCEFCARRAGTLSEDGTVKVKKKWDNMTPEEKKERVKKMQAGRKKKHE